MMQLESLYQEVILEHYRRPHHAGLREPYDAESFQVNPTCGDEITLRIKLDGERVADVSYHAEGCSISQAATSVMTDLVIGRQLDESLHRHDEFLALMQSRGDSEPDEELLEDGAAFVGVSRYPARVKCALLGWMAWKDAMMKATSKEGVQ